MESLKGNLKMVWEMVKDSFFGAMDNIIKDNGKMERKMAVDIGDLLKGKAIWDSGRMGRLLGTESILWKMGRDIKDNL